MPQLNIFRQLHHVCVIVRNLDATVAYYESLGVGPWHDYPSLEPYELEVKDRKGYLNLRYRYANLDNFQLQLCEPGEGDTPQRRFLEERGEGVFHLGFNVPDLDIAESDAAALGLSPWMRARLPDRSGFTYFETREHGAGVTLEIRANKRA